MTEEDETTFIAPIDVTISNGRSQILFGFEYLWEVYKPASRRRWGYYVLPVLYGDRLVGRVEPVYDRERRRLCRVKAWWEQGVDVSEVSRPFALGINGLAQFLGTDSIILGDIGPARFRDAVRREVSVSG